jgi:hypothetical protein
MRTRWWGTTMAAVMAAGILSLTGASPALAQPRVQATEAAKEAARGHYRLAETRYAEGNYAVALPLYEQAEAIIPIPQTKYKIASCRDKLGQPAAAAHWYQLFLDSSPPDRMANEIAEARRRLAALSGGSQVVAPPVAAGPGQVRFAVSPPNAPLVLVIDNGPPQRGAPAINLPPGHHRIVIQADGFATSVAELDLASGETKEVRLTLAPGSVGPVQPGPGPGAPAEPVYYGHRRSNVPGYVLIGVGAAAAIAGIGLGVVALHDKSNFNNNPTQAGADTEQQHALGADVCFVGAIALGVTGIVLVATNTGGAPPQSASRTFFTPYAGPTGAGAVGGFRF